LRGVTLRFGGLVGLADVGLDLRRGEVLAVIGPNGAGQDVVVQLVDGACTCLRRAPSRCGTRRARSTNSRGASRTWWNRLGVARTFQNIRLFGALTALENVKIAAEDAARRPDRSRSCWACRTRVVRIVRAIVGRTSCWRSWGFRICLNELATSLSYGQQRSLEIARALATDPQVLLLDEPAAGTNPTEKLELEVLIRRINRELGVSVLLIEHDMRLVMSVADRVTVAELRQG